jgi:hypothetical protein
MSSRKDVLQRGLSRISRTIGSLGADLCLFATQLDMLLANNPSEQDLEREYASTLKMLTETGLEMATAARKPGEVAH